MTRIILRRKAMKRFVPLHPILYLAEAE